MTVFVSRIINEHTFGCFFHIPDLFRNLSIFETYILRTDDRVVAPGCRIIVLSHVHMHFLWEVHSPLGLVLLITLARNNRMTCQPRTKPYTIE